MILYRNHAAALTDENFSQKRMVPTSDEVSTNVHGALKRLNTEATLVGQDAIRVGTLTRHELGMAGIQGSDT